METIFNYLTFCKKNISRLDVFILLYVFLTMADIPHPLFLYAVIGYGILIYIIIFFKCHLIDCKLVQIPYLYYIQKAPRFQRALGFASFGGVLG